MPPRSTTAPLTSGNKDSFKSRLLFFEVSICLLQPGDGPGESHPDEHRQAICQVAVTCSLFIQNRKMEYSRPNFCHCKGYLWLAGGADRNRKKRQQKQSPLCHAINEI